MYSIQEHRGLLLFEGIVFLILGILAICLPGIFTLGFELLIGWLFLIGGVIQLVRTFQTKSIPNFVWTILSAIVYLVVGGLLLWYPLRGVLTLTFLLALFFLIQGIFQIISSFTLRPMRNWGWTLFSGIVSVIIAAIIWSGWPGTAVWVLGLLVGINLLFAGLSMILLSTAKEG